MSKRWPDDAPTRISGVRQATSLLHEPSPVEPAPDLFHEAGTRLHQTGASAPLPEQATRIHAPALPELATRLQASPLRAEPVRTPPPPPREEATRIQAPPPQRPEATRIRTPPLRESAGLRHAPSLGTEITAQRAAAPAQPASSLAARAAELRPRRGHQEGAGGLRNLFHTVVTSLPRAVKSLSGVEIAARVRSAEELSAEEAWRELRTLPILDGVPNAPLQAALQAGDVKIAAFARDEIIDLGGQPLIVRDGQLAFARFEPAALDAERRGREALRQARVAADKKAEKREEKRRREAGPLIRLATRNLCFFEEGDLVDLHLDPGYACYATTPLRACTIARHRLEAWRREYPEVADRLRRASQAARQRLDAVVGAREEVADFFVRHGLSVSQVLRVRKIDACIECGACEAACEERYGVPRLSLNGRVLGGLDFVDACHTCFDQRCIDPCGFDAIKYDTERREIVIIEEACTGCTLCAPACPYDAIEMHELDEKPLLTLRLQREGKLSFGANLPPLETVFGAIPRRRAKLKRIASKCDHCVTYQDQACISACPTGALFDIAPDEVFHARPEAELARAGFDHSVVIDVRKILDPEVFRSGPDGSWAKFDRARAVRPRIYTTWMWVVGLTAWSLAVIEIGLRKLAPAWSVDFLVQTLVEGIDADIAVSRVDYAPGCGFAVKLGVTGSLVMLIGLAYPSRRRVRWLRQLGSLRAWFELHVMSGVIGPLFVLLHTAAKLDNWVSLAVLAMVGTVVSGLVGRYLSTQLPEKASSAVLDVLDVDRRLAALRARHGPVANADAWYLRYQARVAAAAKRSSGYVLGWLVVDDLRRLLVRLRPGGGGEASRDAARYARRLALFERRRVLLPRLEPLFKRWKQVHVPMAIALTVLGGLHVALALFGG